MRDQAGRSRNGGAGHRPRIRPGWTNWPQRSAIPTASRRWRSTSPTTTGPRASSSAAVERWGRVDFLINNAGVGSPTPLHGTDDETLDNFLDVMLRAPFRLARDVLPHMQPGSAIINITSTFAVVGGLRGGPYSAAKGGLTALTTHIACQYGAHGIRCNAVAPGVIQTPMTEERLQDPAVSPDANRDDAHTSGWARSTTWQARWRSCVRRAAVSSTGRPSWSTADGVRRSTCRSTP